MRGRETNLGERKEEDEGTKGIKETRHKSDVPLNLYGRSPL
jgi:hypothetical protein